MGHHTEAAINLRVKQETFHPPALGCWRRALDQRRQRLPSNTLRGEAQHPGPARLCLKLCDPPEGQVKRRINARLHSVSQGARPHPQHLQRPWMGQKIAAEHQGIGDRHRMPCPIEQGPTRGITMQMLNPNPIPAGDLWSGHRKQGVGHRCQAGSTAPARPLRPKALLDQWFEAFGTKTHHSGDKRLNRTGNLKVLDQSCSLRIPLC